MHRQQWRRKKILEVLAGIIGILIFGFLIFINIFLQGNTSVPAPVPAQSTAVQPETLPEAGIASPVNPLDGSTLFADRNIALAWAMPGASAYKVELWGEPYSLMVPCNWKEGTTCQIGQMAKGHTYSWRVKARNAIGEEANWSPTWTFTISKDGPSVDAPGCLGAPRVQSPTDGEVATGATVTFVWLPPVGCEQPDGYTVRANTSKDDPEAKPWIVDTGKGSSPHDHIFTAPGTYYWYVRACKPCTPYDPGAWAPAGKVVVR